MVLTRYYALTVKLQSRHNKNCVPSDYVDVLEVLKHKHPFKLIHEVYELDSKGKCHLHATISTDKEIFRKMFICKGCTVRVVPVFYMNGWMKYLHKDTPSAIAERDQKEWQEKSRLQSLFI